MATKDIELPNDIPTCHAIIRHLLDRVEKLEAIVAKQQLEIESLKRALYGPRSERSRPESAPEIIAVEKECPLPEKKAPCANGHGRRPLPPDLPRKRVEHEATGKDLVCESCGGSKERIGEETSEQLEYVPATLVVLQHVRGKFACRKCGNGVTTAQKATQPIEKGLAGPGLLAHVAVSKYADHLPLNRQEGILARSGVDIARSTMCGWMADVARLVEPLYETMKKLVLASKVIHTDDTPIAVLDRTRRKTRTGRIWVYVGDRAHPYNIFDYTTTRKRDGPVSFLGGYEGNLHADAYGGYDGIYAGAKVKELACWAHARRKFVEAQSSDPLLAAEAVSRIGMLYGIEEEIRGQGDEERRRARQERSKPILAGLAAWFSEMEAHVLPRGPMGMAIAYTKSNWEALNRYVEDGAFEIDNNTAERALRPIAVGRKNWMFAGSDSGGRTAAILFSMTSTCKRHDIDPFEYLRDIFARISDHPAKRIGELLPGRWKPAGETGSDTETEAPLAAPTA